MESLSLEEENIIKNIRNLFRLKKELNYTAIKDINLLDKKKTTAIIDWILKDITNLFEHEAEKEYYYKPIRVSHLWSNNYVENEKNGDGNNTLSVEEYPNQIKPYLKDIITNVKNAGTWKLQLKIANNFISSINNGEEHVMYPKSDNIEILIDGEAGEIIKKNFWFT